MSLLIWKCPVCGFVMLDLEYRKLVFDAPCRCGHTTISEFHLKTIHSREQPEPPEPARTNTEDTHNVG